MTLDDRYMDCACKSSGGPSSWQRQPGVPGGRDLAGPFYRWRQRLERYGQDGVASAPARPARAAGAVGGRDRAAAAERGRQRSDLGGEPDRGVSAHRWQLRVAPSTVQRALRRAGWRHAGSGSPCSSIVPCRRRACSRSARAGRWGTPSTASRGTSRPASPASCCAWTPSTSGSSRAWARSGRSPPAMPRAPTACLAAPGAHRRSRRPLSASVVIPLYRRAGWRLRRVLTDGGPEFKGAFDEACAPWDCAIPGRSRGMPGPTASSNGSKHDPAGTLGVAFVAATSPVGRPCSGVSRRSCSLTITSGPTKAIASAAVPQPRSSGAPLAHDVMPHSGGSTCLHQSGSGQTRPHDVRGKGFVYRGWREPRFRPIYLEFPEA